MARLNRMERLPLAMSHRDHQTKNSSCNMLCLAEAPLCPADYEETSLSRARTGSSCARIEVLNRAMDAETFPAFRFLRTARRVRQLWFFTAAALALAGKLTAADIPPEEAFHPKRPEEEMLRVVQDNADILHDIQSGALSVEDPKGAEALRHLVKFKEVLKRKFLEGPGSNQSAWEALNRSMVDLEMAQTRNNKYEDAGREYNRS